MIDARLNNVFLLLGLMKDADNFCWDTKTQTAGYDWGNLWKKHVWLVSVKQWCEYLQRISSLNIQYASGNIKIIQRCDELFKWDYSAFTVSSLSFITIKSMHFLVTIYQLVTSTFSQQWLLHMFLDIIWETKQLFENCKTGILIN